MAFSLLDRLISVIARFQATEATLRQQLAEALANDAADAAAIEAAQAAATAATERATAAETLAQQLREEGSANADQLAAINQLVTSLEPAEETAEG